MGVWDFVCLFGVSLRLCLFFFFNDTATTEIYTLSLHDALPISTLTGSAGTASHFAICDSGTYAAGNVLAYGQFTESKVLVSGNTPTVAIGEIAISIASATLSNYAANGMLDRMFRNQAFTISANALGLATATISDSTTGYTVTEVANSNGYDRLTINAAGGAQR